MCSVLLWKQQWIPFVLLLIYKILHTVIVWNIIGVCLITCLNYQVWKLLLFCAKLSCYLLPVWFYHMFPHYIINDTIFQKNLLNINLYFDFCYNISHSRKNSGRYQVFSYVFKYSTCYWCQVLIKLEFSQQIF
jgi:hypothetical protein